MPLLGHTSETVIVPLNSNLNISNSASGDDLEVALMELWIFHTRPTTLISWPNSLVCLERTAS